MTPSGAESSPIELFVENGVGRLTLAAPATRNAIDLHMAESLREAVTELLGAKQLRVLRLAALGPAFCVGGSLREFAAARDRPAHVAHVAETMHEALSLLQSLTVPIVSVVHGAVAGAGLALALAADIVMAGRGATFRSAYTAAGLSPDCGVALHLAKLGAARAMDLGLTNRALTADQAEAWGLVSRVVDDGSLQDEAEQVVELLARGAGDALASTKRLIRSAQVLDWGPQLELEAASIAALAGTADGREGVDAFLQKRRPKFR